MSDEFVIIFIKDEGVYGFGVERSYGCDARFCIEGIDFGRVLLHDEYIVISDEEILGLF